jgi:hypothetical protein
MSRERRLEKEIKPWKIFKKYAKEKFVALPGSH